MWIWGGWKDWGHIVEGIAYYSKKFESLFFTREETSDSPMWFIKNVHVQASLRSFRDITLPTKVCLVKAMVFSSGLTVVSSHVWMWELDYKERWAPKNWCFWTVVLEKTLESPLACKEIQPVRFKGDQPWVFFGRNDAKAETPVLWPPHAKSWLIGKDWPWEGLGAGGKGDDRGWDGWMASLTWWTWVWVNSGSWWWTGRPGMLQFMGSQRDTTEQLNWTEGHSESVLRW